MNTLIHIRTDKKIKEQAQKTAEKLGLSLSAVINAQLRDFVNNQELSVSVEPKFNKKTERELNKILADIKAGRNLVGPFKTTKEMITSLNS